MWAASTYLVLAVAFIIAALRVDTVYFALFFYWTALSLLLVSGAYFFDIARIFRKRENGIIPCIYGGFIPFLLGAQLYNAWSRKHDNAATSTNKRAFVFGLSIISI